jgi:hypothetical protein
MPFGPYLPLLVYQDYVNECRPNQLLAKSAAYHEQFDGPPEEITMYQLSEKDTDTACHALAKQRGQRTFTLVEQDASTVKTIAHWIYLNIETAPPEKLKEALDACINMRDFPNKKNAD